MRKIIFELDGFLLGEIWLKARMAGIGLNEAIVCEFKKTIKKRTKSKNIIPFIEMDKRIAETIVGADLSDYFLSDFQAIRIMRITKKELLSEGKGEKT